MAAAAPNDLSSVDDIRAFIDCHPENQITKEEDHQSWPFIIFVFDFLSDVYLEYVIILSSGSSESNHSLHVHIWISLYPLLYPTLFFRFGRSLIHFVVHSSQLSLYFSIRRRAPPGEKKERRKAYVDISQDKRKRNKHKFSVDMPFFCICVSILTFDSFVFEFLKDILSCSLPFCPVFPSFCPPISVSISSPNPRGLI